MNSRKVPLILSALLFAGMAVMAVESAQTTQAATRVPVPNTVSQKVSQKESQKVSDAEQHAPIKYDMRDKGLLTSVKEQGATETCWSFAANGAMESALKKSGQGTYDLSEDNLIFGVSYKTGYAVGGNQNRAVSYYSSGKGPVAEDQDAFDGAMNPMAKPVVLLKEALYLKNDQAAIKEAIVKYGAVACGAHAPSRRGNQFMNSSTHAYYCPDLTKGNHNVDLVGWDDQYPRTNFTIQPPGDGAYIVKNSYGSQWGDKGYYYVSYYDTAIGEDSVVFSQMGKVDGYKQIYQNDSAGQTAHRGFRQSEAWFANVYSKQSMNEKLAAVGFYTRGDHSSYTAFVVDGYSDPKDLEHARMIKTGVIEKAGYHTIDLDQMVALASGDRFAVVIKLNTPDELCPIATEEPTGKTEGVTSVSGESLISRTGDNWIAFDKYVPNGNICLKAMVR